MIRINLVFTILIIILSFSACTKIFEPANIIDFGYYYTIVHQDSIKLQGDSLLVLVNYNGCSYPQQFDMKYSLHRDKSKVWFKLITDPGPCDMSFFQWLKHKIPEELMISKRLVFIGPRNVSVILL